MGLSAYGKPRYTEELRKIIEMEVGGLFELDPSYFTHPVYGIDMIWEGSVPTVEDIFSERMIEALGAPRHRYAEIGERERDIAASIQCITEEAIVHVGRRLKEMVDLPRLCYAGGVALNCVANRRLLEECGFKDIYIPATPSDAGTAIGAALYAAMLEGERRFAGPVVTARFGPSYGSEDIERALESSGLKYERSRKPAETAAKLLSLGKVVGWFNGRMEFGPRALGGRSILADPRSAETRLALNSRVKYREDFRPFAASILEENFGDYFADDLPASPFMLYALELREGKREEVPAVVHADGSCRIQTVSKAVSPDFHALVSAFYELTGVPMVLNTSFNENEPIVCTPEDAVSVFASTNMDALIIDGYLVTR